MSTVAERLREDSRERLRRMTPADRLAEALRLGQAAIAAYARHTGSTTTRRVAASSVRVSRGAATRA